MSETCKKCGRSKSLTGSGSITQWILSCKCQQQEPLASAEDSILCQRCGLRIEQGRLGSLTQWVFRSDTCRCGLPISQTAPAGSIARRSRTESTGSDEQQEEPIPVDDGLFPQDRFVPLAVLGAGAAGEVFLCRDILLGKKVAVKTLREMTGKQLISFQNEAKANSALNHPGIVKVLDFGVSPSGAPYMVMDYLPAESLKALLDRVRKLEWPTATRIIYELSVTLGYAHAQGIYHRDVKPENILIVESNAGTGVRLIDFGVAKLLQRHDLGGGTTTVVGTPSYMSPDQAAGLAYDARSEIYSLGCVYFEILTGRPPFCAATALELMAMHANQSAPPLGDILAHETVPPAISRIIQTCLAKSPDRRFQTMKELGNELESVLARSASEEKEPIADATVGPSTGVTGAVLDAGSKTSKHSVLACTALLAALAVGGYIVSRFDSVGPVSEKKLPDAMASDDIMAQLTEKGGMPYTENKKKWFKMSSEATADMVKKSFSSEKTLRLNFISLSSGISILPEISNLPVEALDLSNTEASDQSLESIASFKDLKGLWLNGDEEVSDESIRKICTLPKLRELGLRVTAITDEGLRALSKMESLEVLDISDCANVSDRGLSALTAMKGLTTLQISHCSRLSNAGISSFRRANGAVDLITDNSLLHAKRPGWQNGFQRTGRFVLPSAVSLEVMADMKKPEFQRFWIKKENWELSKKQVAKLDPLFKKYFENPVLSAYRNQPDIKRNWQSTAHWRAFTSFGDALYGFSFSPKLNAAIDRLNGAPETSSTARKKRKGD